MDWLDHMNAAMDYIEAHLADEIFYDQAARLACCSTYHFQRRFSYLTGVPLAEYIRRRRLTLAAFEPVSYTHLAIAVNGLTDICTVSVNE